jgi:hypothetical protein
VVLRLDDFQYFFFNGVLLGMSSADLRLTHLSRDLTVSLFPSASDASLP